MTKQALNSLKLYKGNNPDTILQALQFQNKSVVNELMYECQAKDMYDLAMKLSLGLY